MTPATGTRRASPTPSSADPTTQQQTAQQPPHAPAAQAHSLVDEDISRSDNESGGEKPVREKLRDTTIDAAITSSPRGRLHRKRSLEEVEGADSDEDEAQGSRHVRKRSREAVPGADVDVGGDVNGREGTPEARDEDMLAGGLASPKGKRTRDEARAVGGEAATPSEERVTKRVRDSGSPETGVGMSEAAGSTTKIPPTSGFANTSAASPFGSLAPKKDDKAVPQTSDEKFKSSGFGSFASASASPFGAAAPKAASPFGAAAATGAASPWAAKPATPATQPSAFAAAGSGTTGSGFGNTSSTSAFGSLGGSKLGGGFGAGSSSTTGGASVFSGLGSTSKLGSFATATSGSGPTIQGLSSKPAKAFGAANDTDEEEEGDTEEEGAEENAAKSPSAQTTQQLGLNAESDGKKDRRFYERHVETGEEGETTVFTQRAKLYLFEKEGKKWVERGVGVLKLNVADEEDDDVPPPPPPAAAATGEGKVKLMDAPAEDDEDDEDDDEDEEDESKRKVHARLLLRADGSQRVVLNSPVTSGLKFGDDTEPKGQTIVFMGRLSGAPEGAAGFDLLQLKMNPDKAKALWHHVRELQAQQT